VTSTREDIRQYKEQEKRAKHIYDSIEHIRLAVFQELQNAIRIRRLNIELLELYYHPYDG
jgi:hypothetical protein